MHRDEPPGTNGSRSLPAQKLSRWGAGAGKGKVNGTLTSLGVTSPKLAFRLRPTKHGHQRTVQKK